MMATMMTFTTMMRRRRPEPDDGEGGPEEAQDVRSLIEGGVVVQDEVPDDVEIAEADHRHQEDQQEQREDELALARLSG